MSINVRASISDECLIIFGRHIDTVRDVPRSDCVTQMADVRWDQSNAAIYRSDNIEPRLEHI